ncbi:DUF2933 domain-containing protein [Pedobacter flavus]
MFPWLVQIHKSDLYQYLPYLLMLLQPIDHIFHSQDGYCDL